MRSSTDVLSDELRRRGGRVTPQRLAITRLLGELDRHVTAEELHREVEARFPGVSMPTVYATLDLLEELGIVRRVPAATGTLVFDPRTDAHDHMICRACGAVLDLDITIDRQAGLAGASEHGFAGESAQLAIIGLCASCQDASAARPPVDGDAA